MDIAMTQGTVRLRLREIRLQRGLTQSQLADQAGLHTLTISRMEGDPRQIELETLKKLCDSLNVTLAELIVYDKTEEPEA